MVVGAVVAFVPCVTPSHEDWGDSAAVAAEVLVEMEYYGFVTGYNPRDGVIFAEVMVSGGEDDHLEEVFAGRVTRRLMLRLLPLAPIDLVLVDGPREGPFITNEGRER